MKFTFGVLTYNQEQMVVETLESIKYQITHYGKEYEVQLIIVDDCSKDRTTDAIANWLGNNQQLFFSVDCHFNKNNQGVVKNYQYIMGKIQNENFKIIAGDDIFSSANMFSQYDNLNNDTIATFLELDFNESGVYYQEYKLINFFYHMMKRKTKSYHLKNMRRGCYINTPSSIYTKSLYVASKAEQLNGQFTLFEDDPTWYSMIRYGADVIFVPENIVLYRIHNQSISNSGEKNLRFISELNNLIRIYHKDAKGMEKIYLWFRLHPNIPKCLNFSRYVNKALSIQRRKKIAKTQEYIDFKKRVDKIKKREEEHYRHIVCEANKYVLK